MQSAYPQHALSPLSPFTPTRAAPQPPSPRNSLPASHPFATYYVPHSYITHHSSSSTTTFSLFGSPRDDTLPTPSSVASRSSGSSGRNHYRSPTASLAAPLSPRPSPKRAHHSAPAYNYGRSSPSPPPVPLPLDLSLFDPRPRQNLLGDLEYIAGKKFNFPLLSRFTKDKSQAKASEKTRRNGKDSVSSREEKEKRERRVLRKDRERWWQEDFAWEAVQLIPDEKPVRRGRGVREGNWI